MLRCRGGALCVALRAVEPQNPDEVAENQIQYPDTAAKGHQHSDDDDSVVDDLLLGGPQHFGEL